MKRKAAALSYDYAGAPVGAPLVVAKGEGILAHRIIEKAQEKGIPIQENPDLVDALLHVELMREIPPELYQAVAEILAFVYRLNESAALKKHR